MTDLRRMRVCVVAPAYMLGGQAIEARTLVNGLRADDQVTVALQPIDPRIPAAIARVRGVRTIVRWPLYIGGLLRRLWAADIVHVFTAAFWPFLLTTTPAVLLARLFGRRVVLNYRDGRADAHLKHAWVRWVLRRAHVRVFPSGFLLDVFRGHGLDGRVIANVVDTDVFRYRRRDELRPRLISCRLLEELYAIENTIAAFAMIQQRIPDASLVIAGDGHMRDTLESLVADAGLRNVRFTGRVDHVTLARLMDESDIFLNSSRIDNMPHAIVEAFSAGVAVVTTSAGGIPYVVEHGRNGLLIGIDDPAGMADAVLELLANPARARTLMENARRDCELLYTWDAARREWKQLYAELLGRSGATVDARVAHQQLQSTEACE